MRWPQSTTLPIKYHGILLYCIMVHNGTVPWNIMERIMVYYGTASWYITWYRTMVYYSTVSWHTMVLYCGALWYCTMVYYGNVSWYTMVLYCGILCYCTMVYHGTNFGTMIWVYVPWRDRGILHKKVPWVLFLKGCFHVTASIHQDCSVKLRTLCFRRLPPSSWHLSTMRSGRTQMLLCGM